MYILYNNLATLFIVCMTITPGTVNNNNLELCTISYEYV